MIPEGEGFSHCQEIEELLSAFADGEATEAERRLVAGHVAGCKACTGKLKLTAALKASVRKIEAPPAPAALKAALRRAAAQRRASPLSWLALPLARWGLAAAFAAASVFVVVRAARPDEEVPLDVLLAAHNQYALTMPLAPADALSASLAARVAGEEGSRGL